MSSSRINTMVCVSLCVLLLSWTMSARADVSGLVSDDFNACKLNAALWTVVDPIGESDPAHAATVSLTGMNTDNAHLVISIPAGPSRDMEATGSTEVRVVQAANDTDFDVQVKLESVFDSGYQMNGLLVEQDSGVALRYHLVYSGTFAFLYSATLSGGVIVDRGQQNVANASPFWLGITRVGNDWALRYSTDGVTWLTHAAFTFSMTVTQLGPCVGNFGLITAPAFTAHFDYFLNTALPFAAEDAPLAGYALTTGKSGNGSITIDPDQSLYYCGEKVTLTASADPGWTFIGWSGDATGDTNPTQVVMSANKNVTATFQFIPPKGSLQVNIAPPEAIANGAQWKVDEGAWQDSGAVVDGLLVGDHTVAFKDVSGWDKPANQTVVISEGQTTVTDGTYVALPPPTGSLQVTITPTEAITAGAQWNVDGGAWQDSGALVGDLSVGDHTVSFKNISGWDKPVDQTVAVAANQTATANGVYEAQPPPTGSLKVTIVPAAAIIAGAQWNVDGGAWQNSEAVVSGLSLGEHTVSFKNVNGWNKPADQMATIAVGQTTSKEGTYEAQPPPTGSLKVTISPAGVVTAGAQWRVDGGAWQDSGDTVSGLSVGNHMISFKDINGWNTPSDQSASIAAGQTTAASGTYSEIPPPTGSLKVTILPAGAVTAGAQWNVDGGAWLSSGATAAGLSVGNHTVVFKDVSGWTKPVNLTVAITANVIATETGTYTESTTPPPSGQEPPPDDTDNTAPPPMCGFGMVEALACSLFCLMVSRVRRRDW